MLTVSLYNALTYWWIFLIPDEWINLSRSREKDFERAFFPSVTVHWAVQKLRLKSEELSFWAAYFMACVNYESVLSLMHKSLRAALYVETPMNTTREMWFVLQVCLETQRFERLMEYFKNEDNNIDFMVCSHTLLMAYWSHCNPSKILHHPANRRWLVKLFEPKEPWTNAVFCIITVRCFIRTKCNLWVRQVHGELHMSRCDEIKTWISHLELSG